MKLNKKINENEEIELDEESLHQWFKGGGWRQAGGKYDGKPCARQPGQKPRSSVFQERNIEAWIRKKESPLVRKRKKDPNQTKKTGAAKPTYVKTDPQKKGKKRRNETYRIIRQAGYQRRISSRP